MMSDQMIQKIVDWIVAFSSDLLMPSTIFVFVVAAFLRVLVFYTVKRELWFAREFQRRISKAMDDAKPDAEFSFYPFMKKMLERTFYESFVVRAIMKRRNPDFVMAVSDRVFLIQQGSAILVRDTLKQIKYLRKNEERPKFLDISRNIFQGNPCFNRVFGLIPIDATNDFLNILPGLFIVGGIFGTFLGIMDGLPKLSQLDLNDIEGSKLIMDTFLLKISFSMSTSIVGIIVSVSMTLLNTLCAVEKVFMDMVERFENTLDMVWNRSMDNNVPVGLVEFDENKDPIDALASDAIGEELKKIKAPKSEGKKYDTTKLHDRIKANVGPEEVKTDKIDKVS